MDAISNTAAATRPLPMDGARTLCTPTVLTKARALSGWCATTMAGSTAPSLPCSCQVVKAGAMTTGTSLTGELSLWLIMPCAIYMDGARDSSVRSIDTYFVPSLDSVSPQSGNLELLYPIGYGAGSVRSAF